MPLVTRQSNQGNLFKEALTPNWSDGDVWSDTTADKLKINVGGIAQDVGISSFSDSAVVSYSQTITDYTRAATITPTSGNTTISFTSGSSTGGNLYGTQHTIAEKITATSVLIDQVITGLTLYLKKTGSPTGNYTFGVFDGTGTLVTTFGTGDSASLTTSFAAITITFDTPYTIASGDYIGVQFTSGSAGNSVDVQADNSGSYDGTATIFSWYHTGAWNDAYGGMNDCNFVLNIAWVSSAEANPAVYYDVTGSAINLLGIAIYLNAATTETEIKIRCSADTTFTSGETVRTILVSNLTAGAWNYIRFNLKNRRYIQIYGSSGASKILAVSLAKTLYKTDSEVFSDLGILQISATDTSLALDGT